jgi:hypothetical protein
MLHCFLRVIRRRKRWKKSVNTKSGPAGSAASGSLRMRVLEVGSRLAVSWNANGDGTPGCAEWNRKNRAYFREIYLRGRLESFGSGPPKQSSSPISSCRINDPPRRSSPLDLPQEVIQEVIEVKQFIIIEYIVRLLMRGVQEVIHTQLVDKQREIRRLPLSSISRGDSQKPP